MFLNLGGLRHLNEADVNDNSLSNPARARREPNLSAKELEDRMNQVTYIMQQKFLLGEDQEDLDYYKINSDETLDDHWQRRPILMQRRDILLMTKL
ncbi:unnamed protein product [Sphenostylis stenocarpa]|uniref:CCD97-like C-terminal domain-containing protein n=1 Tax=Sphenostylis stenocarpa TaxID=92480 RepID=A0AA86SGN1_9FABA|nr:unnamed protein product [Sphenostylis stenocarpa]